MLIRQSARSLHDLRELSFIPHISRTADGSCVIKMGHTHILCTALLEKDAQEPLTVEYGILPGATHPRTPRERGFISYETQKTQETIKRSLQLVLDLSALGNMGFRIDCDVLQGEGSLRSAAVSGAFVALSLALKKLTPFNLFPRQPLISRVAGLSCGIVKGELILDLDEEEAAQADVIADFVFNEDSQILDMHLRGQRFSVTTAQMVKMAEAVLPAGQAILEAQRRALED